MTDEDKRNLCHKYGYSDEYRDYWIAHPVCEACGQQLSVLPHHIVSRGSIGPDDAPGNLLALCFVCHRGEFETHGVGRFKIKFPHLEPKIRARRTWDD